MTSGSALPRRALGRKLRALRQKADKSRLAAALAIEVSKQTIGRLEDGDPVRVSTSQYRDLLTFYEADDEARSEAMVLVEEVKAEKGNSGVYWRHYAHGEYPRFLHFWSLEQAAEQVTAFKLTLLPGVLQAPDYRRWIMRTAAPDLPESHAEQQLELIATRRRRLIENPDSHLRVILSEAVLQHQIGNRAVMADQARLLLALGELPNVSIQVLPFGAGPHSGLLVQSFTLYEFPTLRENHPPEPAVLYIEGFKYELFLEDEPTTRGLIDYHRSALEDMGRAALDEAATRRLVEEIAQKYSA